MLKKKTESEIGGAENAEHRAGRKRAEISSRKFVKTCGWEGWYFGAQKQLPYFQDILDDRKGKGSN